MKIKIKLSIGLAGCTREKVIDIEDDCTNEEIDEMAQEAVHEMISWHWVRVEPKGKS